ncbi:MAG: glycosyltransferase family 2 protein [Patescibacteria group bacterium]
MTDYQKELSIIIVSWNVCPWLQRCLESIEKNALHVNYEVIIIDNNSMDGTGEMVRNQFPQVKLIKNKINIGFAPACNQGLAESHGEYLLFLNPDTILLENSLQLSLFKIKNEPSIGVLGAKILNPDLSCQRSCRRFPDLISQLMIILKLHYIFPNNGFLKKYLMLDCLENETREVDQVMGAFFLTKREVLEKVGSFDEKYVLWFEEVDFCQRVKRLGYKVVFFHEAKIIHLKGESFKQIKSLKKQIYWNNSLIHYFKKYGQVWDIYVIYFFYPLSLILAVLTQILIFLKYPTPKNNI